MNRICDSVRMVIHMACRYFSSYIQIVSESEESEQIEIRPHHQNNSYVTKQQLNQDYHEAISLADLTNKPIKAISKTSL